MKSACEEVRNKQASATSEGRPRRLSGVTLMTASLASLGAPATNCVNSAGG